MRGRYDPYPNSEARGLCSSLASFRAATMVGLEGANLRGSPKRAAEAHKESNNKPQTSAAFFPYKSHAEKVGSLANDLSRPPCSRS